MCGLAGMVGLGIQNVDLETFHDLLYFSAVRGPHSTGLLTVASRNEKWAKHPRIEKRTGPSPYFIMADASNKSPQLKDRGADVFLAHCRWATVGAHTVENAHPFDTGRYISAHNGTLYDSWSYAKDNDKSDSQLMFEKMEQDGIVSVLQGMRETSAYAISIYDRKNRTVILARNSLRPLYIGISAKRDVMYWASEYGMLYAASARNNVEMKIFPLPVAHVYYIDPSKVKKGKENPWGVTKLNPNPLELSTSKVRSSESTIDWGAWENWQSGKNETDKSLAVYDYSLTGGSEIDDLDDGLDYAAANKIDESKTVIDLNAKGKNYIMTNEELENLEMARANSTSSIPVFTEDELSKASAYHKPKNYKGPKAQKAASKRQSILGDIDKLIDGKIQQIDQLFEDVKAEQLHEAAQKAIEEAQAITATKRPAKNPFYTEDYQENEDCCICNRVLGKQDFREAEGVEVDGTRWFVCKGCQEDLHSNAVTMNRR